MFMKDMSKAENLALVYIADHFSYEKSRSGIVYDFIKSCDDSTEANKFVHIIIISGILIVIIALIAILYKLKRK